MTHPTLEKAVARAISSTIIGDSCRRAARAAIPAVLAHFGKPENVTEGMVVACKATHGDYEIDYLMKDDDWRKVVAASMRAAAEGK